MAAADNRAEQEAIGAVERRGISHEENPAHSRCDCRCGIGLSAKIEAQETPEEKEGQTWKSDKQADSISGGVILDAKIAV
jgi:hypothetical protein